MQGTDLLVRDFVSSRRTRSDAGGKTLASLGGLIALLLLAPSCGEGSCDRSEVCVDTLNTATQYSSPTTAPLDIFIQSWDGDCASDDDEITHSVVVTGADIGRVAEVLLATVITLGPPPPQDEVHPFAYDSTTGLAEMTLATIDGATPIEPGSSTHFSCEDTTTPATRVMVVRDRVGGVAFCVAVGGDPHGLLTGGHKASTMHGAFDALDVSTVNCLSPET